MRMSDIAKPITQMSDEELLDRVRSLRREKFEVRPAKQRRVEAPAKREVKATKLKINKTLQGMSLEELEALQRTILGEDNEATSGVHTSGEGSRDAL